MSNVRPLNDEDIKDMEQLAGLLRSAVIGQRERGETFHRRRRMKKAGLTLRQIAEIEGVSHQAIHDSLTRGGVDTTREPAGANMVPDIKAGYMTYREIAEKHGVTEDTVRCCARRNGIGPKPNAKPEAGKRWRWRAGKWSQACDVEPGSIGEVSQDEIEARIEQLRGVN